MADPHRLDPKLVLNQTGDTYDAVLQRILVRRGMDVVARFVAGGEDVDDEVEFWSPDGTLRHPVGVQIGSGYMCVVVYDLDASGEVEAATHGLMYTRFDGVEAVVPDLMKALRANPAVPVPAAEGNMRPR